MLDHLFSSLQVGGLVLKNRLTMAPLYLGYAGQGGTVSPLLLDHYRLMAPSGVALVVVENSTVDHPTGRPIVAFSAASRQPTQDQAQVRPNSCVRAAQPFGSRPSRLQELNGYCFLGTAFWGSALVGSAFFPSPFTSMLEAFMV
jgi:hypothetical protein